MADNENSFKTEFEELISNYMLQFFDSNGEIETVTNLTKSNDLVEIFNPTPENMNVRFYPCQGNQDFPSPFYCQLKVYSDETGKKKAAETILRELLKVTEYRYKDGKYIKQRDYGTEKNKQISYKKSTLDLAFELGICTSLVPTFEDACTLHAIIAKMIGWASRTYEGKKVPFGIVIDFDEEQAKNEASYIHFLENDCSAVFTDGMFSGILLDKKGNLISFLTRNQNKTSEPEYQTFVPYQFIDISEYCTKSRIGVIVQTNGEIMLIKKQAICFANRGRKWVYFEYNKILSKLRPYFLYSIHPITVAESVARKSIKAIYCTLLDVSFSHTGGCLAIVFDNDKLEKDNVIKERFDLYLQGKLPDGIDPENKEKITILRYLLENTNHNVRSFYDIEKPLRREILSLDGATVLSINGTFYCAGTIVALPGGSTGGGRSAAAQKLAEYGVGIKISEDGYIEAYGKPLNGETSSESIILLFKIK